MQSKDFTTSISVDQTPSEVFNAIRNVRGWWSEEIEGATSEKGDVFTYHYKDVHFSKIKLMDVVPNERVVWLVLDNHFKFTEDKGEWIGNKIIFEIIQKGRQTELQFTQAGLVEDYECFEICRDAWTNYITKSLHSLITTGKGNPNAKENDFNGELLKEHFETK